MACDATESAQPNDPKAGIVLPHLKGAIADARKANGAAGFWRGCFVLQLLEPVVALVLFLTVDLKSAVLVCIAAVAIGGAYGYKTSRGTYNPLLEPPPPPILNATRYILARGSWCNPSASCRGGSLHFAFVPTNQCSMLMVPVCTFKIWQQRR